MKFFGFFSRLFKRRQHGNLPPMHASPSIIKKAFKQKSKRELIEIIMYFLSVYQDPEIKKLVKKRMSREARDDQKNPA